MATIEINESNFEGEVLSSDTPVLVDFWAEWCGPCKAISPVVDELAGEYTGRLKVGKVNVDASAGIAAKYGVRSIPTLLLFKGGELQDTMIGARSKGEMVKMVDKVLAPTGA